MNQVSHRLLVALCLRLSHSGQGRVQGVRQETREQDQGRRSRGGDEATWTHHQAGLARESRTYDRLRR